MKLQNVHYDLLQIAKDLEGSAGAIFNSINKSQIESIELLLPPLAEQQHTVARLDVAFAKIETIFATTSSSKESYMQLKSAVLAQELNPSEAA